MNLAMPMASARLLINSGPLSVPVSVFRRLLSCRLLWLALLTVGFVQSSLGPLNPLL